MQSVDVVTRCSACTARLRLCCQGMHSEQDQVLLYHSTKQRSIVSLGKKGRKMRCSYCWMWSKPGHEDLKFMTSVWGTIGVHECQWTCRKSSSWRKASMSTHSGQCNNVEVYSLTDECKDGRHSVRLIILCAVNAHSLHDKLYTNLSPRYPPPSRSKAMNKTELVVVQILTFALPYFDAFSIS